MISLHDIRRDAHGTARKNPADGGHVLCSDGLPAGELCGTEIAAAVERRTEGRVRLGPGTLYTILGRFLEEELIREVSVHGRQRNYRLTEEGLRVYQAELARLHRCVADAEKEERHDTSD